MNLLTLAVPLDRISSCWNANLACGPDDGAHTHGEGNGTNTVVHVTIRRTESERSDTDHIPDRLACPSEFCDNLKGVRNEADDNWSVLTCSFVNVVKAL